MMLRSAGPDVACHCRCDRRDRLHRLVSAATSRETAVVAIIHPMQPIGNIDRCH